MRHGESEWNAQHRWQGHHDVPLTSRGEAQAKFAASQIAGTAAGSAVEQIVASDLVRAHRTAAILASALGVAEVRLDPRLRERHMGEWTGLTMEETEARYPGLLEQYWSSTLEQIPGGESTTAMLARVLAGVEAIVARHPEDTLIVAVTHGGVIRQVEDHLGLERTPTGNLCGRWLRHDAHTGLVAGEAFVVDAG